MSKNIAQSFGTLFKELRLQASIETLKEFANLLADKGFIYEESIFSHWQSGNKIPSQRKVLIAVIGIFKDRIANISKDLCNEFLATADQGFLTDKEQESLQIYNGKKYLQNNNSIIISKDKNQLYNFHILSQFYLKKLVQYNNSEEKSNFLKQENNNILSIMQKCSYYGFHIIVIKLWQNCGRYLWDQGLWKQFSYYGEIAYASAIKLQDIEAQASICIQDLGWCYLWQADLPRAKRYIAEGLNIAQEYQLFDWVALGQQRLGKIYQAEKKYNDSIRLLQKSLKYFEQLKEKERIGDTFTYISESFVLTKNFKVATNYFQKALSIADEINDLPQKAILCNRMGELHLMQNQYKEAEKNLFESLLLETRIKRRAGGKAWNNIGLGIIYFQNGEINKAKSFFMQAKDEMRHLGIQRNTYNTSFHFLSLKDFVNKTPFFNI